MKRFIAILLCALSVLTLFAACGDDAPAVERIKELDGTVWPLDSQTFADGTGYTSADLNSFGFYGCISFSGGKFTLILDTSPLTGDYNINGDTVELVNAYNLTRKDNTLVLETGGASLNFVYNSSLVPAEELRLNGTVWDLTYMKNDNGIYNNSVLASEGIKGTISFDSGKFKMVNDYSGTSSEQSGTYELSQTLVSLVVGEETEAIYGFINGANLIVAESGISMVYTIRQ